MYLAIVLVSVLMQSAVAQNVNYTIGCTSHTEGDFTLTFTNHGDSVPYNILLDCEGYENSVFLPPATSVEYPAQMDDQSTTHHTSDICVFGETQVRSDFVSVLVRVLGPGYMDMAIDFVYCDIRPHEQNVYKFASTTCQEDEQGEVTVVVDNPYDIPLRFYSFWCGEYSDMTGVVSPGSSITLSTVLLDDQDVPPADRCFFSPDLFPEPLMLYFNFESWAKNGIEQVLNCYKGRPQIHGHQKSENNWKKPIIKLFPNCPAVSSESFTMEIRTDVPLYGLAKCRNVDLTFTTTDSVSYTLAGTFDNKDMGACQFYKKSKTDTYTLVVEMGWGEKDSKIVSRKKIKIVTCSYADHGDSKSPDETLTEWFISPDELQYTKGRNSTASFELSVVDVLGRLVTSDHVSVGRKIRLKATDVSGSSNGFRALSCSASNGIVEYSILRAGCGDGLVLPKQSGFITSGKQVFSPFFEAFKLKGGTTLRFFCDFTVCESGSCDGSSCPVIRQRRSVLGTSVYSVESAWVALD